MRNKTEAEAGAEQLSRPLTTTGGTARGWVGQHGREGCEHEALAAVECKVGAPVRWVGEQPNAEDEDGGCALLLRRESYEWQRRW